jgi:hypothetical protein
MVVDGVQAWRRTARRDGDWSCGGEWRGSAADDILVIRGGRREYRHRNLDGELQCWWRRSCVECCEDEWRRIGSGECDGDWTQWDGTVEE